MDEDDVVLWQDLLDSVAAGREKGLQCPFCQETGKKGEVEVKREAHKTRLECRTCKRFIEGKMAE
jgi:hypothetical protein